MRPKLIQTSKKLSWLLRHGATEAGLRMDAAGWVPVGAVLKYMRIDHGLLKELVRTNPKRRLELAEGKVRCAQGHSFEVPVTREALEASWGVRADEGSIWHGTGLDALEGIDKEGIQPIKRTHVHLTDSPDSKTGIRSRVHVLLEVSPARLRSVGVEVFQSANGVVLVRRVPRDCIVGLVTQTRRAQRAAETLSARFSDR